ncbi:hypothetical protein JTE90_026759 [Oedothorax gibbosus]|uniref:MATH domain-containing protein n=1 Tax=Oedothorax gibbosus TaxID=931172 RepID=A0AAV6UVZ2_9ARAC|nr:hypothetical protein JTE90_026759 [Oedothorax gibbosus]
MVSRPFFEYEFTKDAKSITLRSVYVNPHPNGTLIDSCSPNCVTRQKWNLYVLSLEAEKANSRSVDFRFSAV